ncbi:DUF547 domain-containing protein [Algibacter amylolyticus]|uniref:DUF547 domain-containing protein n=1 Tax=Algibacter amylolyticus TaxID=1608400 RepID=A0A5M7BH42_9FLAO|nr:DUF547 domain-containing protein [Algibacter amylolyticus]KAA5828060.1 DUF547 domain-containing protein [Algibacter amylolyticus]MBB5267308.1 hypothetical protein [Algibacter amylolyticus]TSJ82305.1 DUF547 domain-containing protein [Algibacter amylolyticus]
MKYLFVITLVLLLFSCAGTKNITEQPIAKTPPIEKTEQVVTEQTTPTDSAPETPATKAPERTNNIEHQTQEVAPSTLNHNDWDSLLQKHVSAQGNVNYKGFKTDRKALTTYITKLGNHVPDNSWLKEEKLAYWINTYNALTVDLILRHYPIKSIKDIKNPWDQRFWKLGNTWYNLNEIEHDILRKMDDPRIHFAIVCASFSCPKLQNEAFTSQTINNQLNVATKAFLSDSTRNNISENSIKISKIFQWFSKDFKQHGSLIDFLNRYSAITIFAKAKKSYKDYNWDLNE